jgi:hypothetical protein
MPGGRNARMEGEQPAAKLPGVFNFDFDLCFYTQLFPSGPAPKIGNHLNVHTDFDCRNHLSWSAYIGLLQRFPLHSSNNDCRNHRRRFSSE